MTSAGSASDDTPPQPGWHHPRSRHRISWLRQVCILISTIQLLTLWILLLIGPHDEQSQWLPDVRYMMMLMMTTMMMMMMMMMRIPTVTYDLHLRCSAIEATQR